jgi:hypothetical protein
MEPSRTMDKHFNLLPPPEFSTPSQTRDANSTCQKASQMNLFRTANISKIALATVAWMIVSAASADALKLNFVTHAAFFSGETKQAKTLDPQAFVQDVSAPEAVGPQGIKHIAGFRPAFIDQDVKTAMVFNANGQPLGFDLGAWLGATGAVEIADAGAGPVLTATFSGLKPGGQYSLFENHFDQKPVGFTPMDGAGTNNNFVAATDGSAKVTMKLTRIPTHANAVLLVYHSDGKTHGTERGPIGVDAHHQLIARPE